MPRYRFELVCPRCGNSSELNAEIPAPPDVKCGECLFNDVEIVAMNVVKTTKENQP
jgi:hypothetical protein